MTFMAGRTRRCKMLWTGGAIEADREIWDLTASVAESRKMTAADYDAIDARIRQTAATR